MRVAERHADDLARCRAILRAGSKSFHAASLLLPRRVREPASVVYAFCRVADDAVDLVSPRQGPEAVARLRRRLDAVYRDHPDDHPVDRALAVVVARHGIPRAVPDALLEGFDWDVEGRRYDDLSGVLAYSARVASTVGVMMTVLMGQRAPGVIARACDLGAAMQLTNICRDVGEDARNGRVYLPLTWLREADVDVDAWIANPTCTPAIATVTTRLLAEADRLYARADAGVAMLPRDCRSAIRAARLLYADIGRVVLGRGGNSVDARAVVPTWRKLGLLLRASMARLSRSRAPALDAPPPLEEVRFLVDAVARHPTTETLPS